MAARSWFSFGRRSRPARDERSFAASPPLAAAAALAPAPASPRRPARVIVVGNEKGGAGKTTVAVLLAVALLYKDLRVAVIDLDLRQQSLSRFLSNRRRWLPAAGVSAPVPLEYKLTHDPDQLSRADPGEAVALFEQAIAMALGAADIVVIDTPGGDTPVSRAAHLQADLVITPMNDSYVDFDVLGVVDPVSLELVRPSHYAQVVLDARQTRAAYGRGLDWVVLRNRLASAEARNRVRLQSGIEALAAKVGFRIGPHLRDRVIYRELFPFGLTVADLSPGVRPVKVSAPREAVREELKALLEALDIDRLGAAPAPRQGLGA